MSRPLPARPSLVHLKHQAKDLRILAREGDESAAVTLRHLRRFQGASAPEIASARVSLGEAQYALALAYGFASWPALKKHVESLRATAAGAMALERTPEGGALLGGLESACWGSGTRRQNSLIAAMAVVSEHAGDDADYDALMGESGAAFRVQMSQERLCPSSPNAVVGFDCRPGAASAWGRKVEWVRTDDAHVSNRVPARSKAVESVERGMPVLYQVEECSLAVGYTAEGFLVRPYAAQREGYEPIDRWPWEVGFALEKTRDKTDLRTADDVALPSLRLAIDLFDAREAGRYACGRDAYRRWAELLTDDASISGFTPQQRFGAILGHAHTLDSLADARAAAVNYLASLADVAPAVAQADIAAAAAAFGELEGLLWRERRAMAPYPWELESLAAWTAELRSKQADFLSDVAERDAKAIDCLRRATAFWSSDRAAIAAT
jgi:hypothetical protein